MFLLLIQDIGMKYIQQINENCKLYEFDPNKNYSNGKSPEEKLFCIFLKQYGWEKFKHYAYNRGRHHIYVIFDYKSEDPVWVGYLHALECDAVSKKCIQELHFLKEDLFRNRVVFIHTINVGFFFRHRKYATYMVDIVKQRFSSMADIMVEATKKGKKFWPAVGFIKVQKTPKGLFMVWPKGRHEK